MLLLFLFTKYCRYHIMAYIIDKYKQRFNMPKYMPIIIFKKTVQKLLLK